MEVSQHHEVNRVPVYPFLAHLIQQLSVRDLKAGVHYNYLPPERTANEPYLG